VTCTSQERLCERILVIRVSFKEKLCLLTASTDSSENDTVWATASEGSSEEDQQ
jgi:hypothetical protein